LCAVTLAHFVLAQPARAGLGEEMRIERRFTTEGASPYADIEFRTTSSEIRNPDGSVVFAAEDIAVPAAWTQVA